nr:E3 ubiquitin-protein ligase RZFP34-like isoform X1 [Ipomoea batatas]GMD48864.1 E3 ubiquitin-protein ligase RZFP34-like isoform X1 [Ipomoea batatas]
MISLFYNADIQYIWNASRRCSLTTSIHALFAQNPSVICQSVGKNLMKRLLQLQCRKCTRTRWCGYYAMTVEKYLRCNSTSWVTNA